ncbi:hypothetical protein GCK32_011202 [Trichostrongylus colubriformis]|uniref:Membralin n=1 Tax=Trichostrongylus colubriformis TaxID=6319 RepID=A0AAN8F1N5_TRICO
MADRPAELNVDVDVPQANQQQNRNGDARAQAQALCLLFTLLFVHLMFTRSSATCLDHIRNTWPKDGVVRLEVVHNLRTLEYKENWMNWYRNERNHMTCNFNPADVLLYGPQAIPAEVREGRSKPLQKTKHEYGEREAHGGSSLLSYFLRVPTELLLSNDDAPEDADATDDTDSQYGDSAYEQEVDAETAFTEHFRKHFKPEDAFRYEYRVEYSLLYGILRLPLSFRNKHNITTLWARIDADSECFGDSFSRRVMRTVVGFEDVVMASLRALAQNSSHDETAGLGYLHDLSTNEHFHFVSFMMSKSSYITAAIVMLIFTFAISMLLRFSHHQIFLFIVDLLHMFELNQPLVFPAAPLLTVILALVGMEAIMSEVFADTTTAFYVILIVWIADQYDAICCHSHVSKRFWLRFFYLYQFFFYAYQYRFGGQYGGMALVTSTAFIFPTSPLDVQQVTVSVHTRAVVRDGTAQRANPTSGGTQIIVQQDQAETASTSLAHAELVNAERTVMEPPPTTSSADAVERVANEVVSEAIDDLFLS